MSFPIKNGVNADEVAVNSNKQASVILETDVATKPQYVGAIRNFNENDPGVKTGTPYLKSSEISQDYRQRVGVDTVLFSYTFNAITQNTGLWKHSFITMTMTQSAGSAATTPTPNPHKNTSFTVGNIVILPVNSTHTGAVPINGKYLQVCNKELLPATVDVPAAFTFKNPAD